MEEKNELDDLILQGAKPSGVKRMLLAAAILLLVLIIIILVTKSLVETDQKPQSSIVLPPEPATQPAEPKEPLFEEVPIEEAQPAPTPVEKIIRKAKEQERQLAQPVQPVQQEEVAPAKPAKTSRKTVSTPRKKSEPTKQAKAKPAPSKRAAKTTTPSTKASKGSYYIQVGAFFKYPPDKKFLRSIEAEGYGYTIIEGVKNGVKYKKVLVGPYPSRKAAKSDLARIKRRINQNAYIFKLK
jgi:DedD protein